MKNSYWKNKNIVITGGTSGLGKALSLKLSQAGANIVVVARRNNLIDELIKEDSKISAIKGDISKKDTIHSIAAEINTQFSKIDILFNIASYLGESPLKYLIDTECEDFEEVLQTNLLGPFRLTKLLAPSMILNEKGLIVNISSDAAVNAYPKWGSYSISKAAVDHMSRIFDEELKDNGVRFLSIDPGDMATPMHFKAVPDANKDELRDPSYSASLLIDLVESEEFKSVRRSL
jgi:NAD(P)-dependent dehydrogenase (short-subunit alcohol dehydrogenase family)